MPAGGGGLTPGERRAPAALLAVLVAREDVVPGQFEDKVVPRQALGVLVEVLLARDAHVPLTRLSRPGP